MCHKALAVSSLQLVVVAYLIREWAIVSCLCLAVTGGCDFTLE